MDFVPKVSIVIPVYNGSDFLSQAIDSALAQTYSNIEVIVVNDGSSDNDATEKIALSYGDKIRSFKKENGGVATALNTAISEMSGDYFSWLSHDDLYYPDKINSQIQALSNMDQQKTILYGDYVFFYEDANSAITVLLPEVPPENFRYFITTKNCLHGCTLLIPKVAFKECGIFDCKLRTTQDFDLWFRMAEKFNFVHIPQLLVKARQHAGQGSVRLKDTAIIEINDLLTTFVSRLKQSELISATNKSISLSYAEIAASMMQRGFYSTANFATDLALKNISNWATINAIKTIKKLIVTKFVYYLIGLLRSSFVWPWIVRPLKHLFYRFKTCNRSEKVANLSQSI